MNRFSLHELSLLCSVLNSLKKFSWQALMLISSALDKRHIIQFILVPNFIQAVSFFKQSSYKQLLLADICFGSTQNKGRGIKMPPAGAWGVFFLQGFVDIVDLVCSCCCWHWMLLSPRVCGAGVPRWTPVNFTEMSKPMNINKPCLDALTQGKVRENQGVKSDLTFEGSLYFVFYLSSALTYSCSDRRV